MKTRILFVDNEPNLLNGLQRLLRPMREQWEMYFAANGREAMEFMQTTPCEVVVTDLFMPEQEGLETIMALRREHPTTKIIAISGGGYQGKFIRALDIATKLGATSTLQKPFSSQQMIHVLQEVIHV
ncbi:response regulator [Candidatus Entotheonella serta]|nr:response regulator [Candidatus Entotheonella serta]